MKTITKIVLCSIILCAITAAVTYYVAQIGVHRTGTISAAPQGFVPKAHFKKAHDFSVGSSSALFIHPPSTLLASACDHTP